MEPLTAAALCDNNGLNRLTLPIATKTIVAQNWPVTTPALMHPPHCTVWDLISLSNLTASQHGSSTTRPTNRGSARAALRALQSALAAATAQNKPAVADKKDKKRQQAEAFWHTFQRQTHNGADTGIG